MLAKAFGVPCGMPNANFKNKELQAVSAGYGCSGSVMGSRSIPRLIPSNNPRAPKAITGRANSKAKNSPG
jgi:hypothetical protein